MIWLTWVSAGTGLVCVRQFFHDVRPRARLSWLIPLAFCIGVGAVQVAAMPEDAAIILLFKIFMIGSALSILWFIGRYSMMDPWWKNAVGQTIIIKDILLLALLTVAIVSLFFTFNRHTSHLAAWLDLTVFAGLPPVMLWRTEVWQRIHDAIPVTADDGEAPAGGE